MRQIKTQNGYTIVETLIVVAVTGAMLLATTLLLSGQIAKNQFKTSSLNFEQRLADSINDVSTGYFTPPSGPVSCSGGPGASDCIYVGKKIEIIGTADRKMKTTSLYLENDDQDPFQSPGNSSVKTAGTVEEDLPGALDFNNDVTYYVLFNTYPDTTVANNSQGQSVGIYAKNGDNYVLPSSTFELKASSGSREVFYCISDDRGSPVVTKKYDGGC